MNIEELNKNHGIDGQVKFMEGAGGFPFIMIDNAKAGAVISIYGGQVLSFQPANEQNLMFLSEVAYYEAGKGIKGGAPICWPWFGPHPDDYDPESGKLLPPERRHPLPYGFFTVPDTDVPEDNRTDNVFFSCSACHSYPTGLFTMRNI